MTIRLPNGTELEGSYYELKDYLPPNPQPNINIPDGWGCDSFEKLPWWTRRDVNISFHA